MHVEMSPNGVSHLVDDRGRCATCGRAHDWTPTASRMIEVRQVTPGHQVTHVGRHSRTQRRVRIDRTWHVYHAGVLIGRVAYVMRTRETRSRGRTYVNSRWQSPAWIWDDGGDDRYPDPHFRGLEAYSKTDAIARVVDRAMRRDR